MERASCLLCGSGLEFSLRGALAAVDPADRGSLAPLCLACCLDKLVVLRGGLAFRSRPPARAMIDPGRVVVTPSAVTALMTAGESVEVVLARHADMLDSVRVVTRAKVGRVELVIISDIRHDGEAATVVMRVGESRVAPGVLPLPA